jgi:hypothetical protein
MYRGKANSCVDQVGDWLTDDLLCCPDEYRLSLCLWSCSVPLLVVVITILTFRSVWLGDMICAIRFTESWHDHTCRCCMRNTKLVSGKFKVKWVCYMPATQTRPVLYAYSATPMRLWKLLDYLGGVGWGGGFRTEIMSYGVYSIEEAYMKRNELWEGGEVEWGTRKFITIRTYSSVHHHHLTTSSGCGFISGSWL